MSQLVTAAEVYAAARETCSRLYVAAGGNPAHTWTVQPYPSTAAIARNWRGFDLYMPALPLDARLSRREADLMAAYVVHELMHALETDFGVTSTARSFGCGKLLNAIEDVRIEHKAATCAAVPQARALLETLTCHVHEKALAGGWRFDDPRQFAYTLCTLGMIAHNGYSVPGFPVNWRAACPANWVPVLEMALAALPGLTNTADAMALAEKIQSMFAMLPQPAPQPKPQAQKKDPAQMSDDELLDELFGDDADKGEGEDGDAQADAGAQDKDKGKGEGEGDKGAGDAQAKKPGAGKGEGVGDDMHGAGKPEGDASRDASQGSGAGKGGGDAAIPDLSDSVQAETEADLSDIAQDVADRSGKSLNQIVQANAHAADFLNCADCAEGDVPAMGEARAASTAARLESPARLRRHLTQAVKSPERVATLRNQSAGRFDLRQMVSMEAGNLNVFRRRDEEEGREAAVSVLLDLSGSMGKGQGSRMEAAAVMAMHIGDALKAAGVAFEIAGFRDHTRRDGAPAARLIFAKQFRDGWKAEARGKTASLLRAAGGGTSMLPAMRSMALRLLQKGNVTRRVLLVLTDGQDGYSQEADRACVEHFARRGVEIIGLGLMCDASGAFGRDRHALITSLGEVSQAGLAALVRVLDGSNVSGRRVA